ncbi:hypothetical protein ACF06V_38255 [Streptomyces bobili]|uniref:hypothetical protein n=1 Tax=Streptomyces bobili TaxID=67280 RepID=UPI0036F6F3DF
MDVGLGGESNDGEAAVGGGGLSAQEPVHGLADAGAFFVVLLVHARPAWAKKRSDEYRRGLTALFWFNINPYVALSSSCDVACRWSWEAPRSTGEWC